ncbi:MAG: TraR/DksA family transcriptional regulator [Endomicrobium sp.]|jgi:DnaK suppressor protein|nr:TraR/DksA family transcriptional regulator [Endomicrobium sp.]
MNKKDLINLKRTLIQKRTELLNKSNNNARSGMNVDLDITNVGDEIDTASNNSEKEIYFELISNDKMTLNAVNDALSKIEKDNYGKCEYCGYIIPLMRLKAIPWTKYCIKCQEEIENPKK